jgi:cytosine deaminase
MAFVTLPTGDMTLTNVTVPGCLAGQERDVVRTQISVSNGQIVAQPQPQAVNMGGAMVLPAFVDMHTHLDKGHISGRAPNPDGTFMGALTTVADDRTNHWSATDVRSRMEFGLRCARAHGTRAIRTHLDSVPPQDEITWPVFRDLRAEWAGEIDLQGVSLIGCDTMDPEGRFRSTADMVADAGGVLGMVAYPIPDLRARLVAFLAMAADRGLSVDFHVDETMDFDSECLRMIARTVIQTGFDARVVVGHLCSLSTQNEARAQSTLDLVAEAGLHVVSLPMCNLYLQDRHAGRTPRGRGITLVHEAKARGIPVSFASDNTRDPFYAYGDLDMLEVLSQATRIGHLDHADLDWVRAVSTTPAATCGFDVPTLEPGAPADLVLFRARDWTELFARPQSDRIVLRTGQAIDRTLPDYSELDHLMETA